VQPAAARHQARIVLDLEGVPATDSTRLSALVTACRAAMTTADPDTYDQRGLDPISVVLPSSTPCLVLPLFLEDPECEHAGRAALAVGEAHAQQVFDPAEPVGERVAVDEEFVADGAGVGRVAEVGLERDA
jgi:hypothetical protein